MSKKKETKVLNIKSNSKIIPTDHTYTIDEINLYEDKEITTVANALKDTIEMS